MSFLKYRWFGFLFFDLFHWLGIVAGISVSISVDSFDQTGRLIRAFIKGMALLVLVLRANDHFTFPVTSRQARRSPRASTMPKRHSSTRRKSAFI